MLRNITENVANASIAIYNQSVTNGSRAFPHFSFLAIVTYVLGHLSTWMSFAPEFGGNNSENSLHYKDDTLGIILSPIPCP